MRVLVAGGNGLIGGALVARLRAAGHGVVLAGRRVAGDAESLPLDFASPPAVEALAPRLAGFDAVVNAVGVFRQTPAQSFDAVHVNGPRTLFRAAVAAGVPRLLQLSALGADPASPLPYFASKGRADAELRALAPRAWVVRPSLVFAPQGPSTLLFATLAALPLTPLPARAGAVQPLHLDDLAELMLRLLEREGGGTVEAVGPQALPLRDYLAMFKRRLRLGGAFATVPAPLARAGAAVAGLSAAAPLDADALRMLERGSTADPAPVRALLGRAPRAPAGFIGDAEVPALRQRAQLRWLLPLLRASVALMWLATAWVSAFVYPKVASLALLARVGLEGAMAEAALYGAAALDAVLGVAVLAAPRHRPLVYRLMIALVLGYTAIITLWLPEYWAHPYGPVLKNVPLLALLLALARLDDPRWT
ncbi:MAG TPA: SDR family oxidoreductase [Pseudoxanthomonas sp.]|nr:SDR family oxidoreductase [Pseudoxanthomonas sp.]